MRTALVLAATAALACVSAIAAATPPVPISDSDLRVAYFGAPLITNRQAKAVPAGITQRQLSRRLHGRSANWDRTSHGRTWKICITYPVKGSGVKYADGFVTADEWEFCFGFNGRLKRKFFTPV
jgi:hypothetical protein